MVMDLIVAEVVLLCVGNGVRLMANNGYIACMDVGMDVIVAGMVLLCVMGLLSCFGVSVCASLALPLPLPCARLFAYFGLSLLGYGFVFFLWGCLFSLSLSSAAAAAVCAPDARACARDSFV